MTVDLEQVKEQVTKGVNELLDSANLSQGDIFVLGI